MVRCGERRVIWWDWESGVLERDWASVKPDQPLPRMRIRGLVFGEEGGECLERFEGVVKVEVERVRLDGGGVGVEGREEVWERVVGAILVRRILYCCEYCNFEPEMKRK
jgi:hypothetical protein